MYIPQAFSSFPLWLLGIFEPCVQCTPLWPHSSWAEAWSSRKRKPHLLKETISHCCYLKSFPWEMCLSSPSGKSVRYLEQCRLWIWTSYFMLWSNAELFCYPNGFILYHWVLSQSGSCVPLTQLSVLWVLPDFEVLFAHLVISCHSPGIFSQKPLVLFTGEWSYKPRSRHWYFTDSGSSFLLSLGWKTENTLGYSSL